MRMLLRLEGLDNDETFTRLVLFSREQRMLRGDLIEVYKGYWKGGWRGAFPLSRWVN